MATPESSSPLTILTDPNLEVPQVLLNANETEGLFKSEGEAQAARVLASERRSITLEFKSQEKPVYVTVGLFDDGQPAELFITAPHLDANTMYLLHYFARSISLGLQNNVPLDAFSREFSTSSFELIQRIFQWLESRFELVKPATLDTISKPQLLDVTEV